VRTRYRKAVGGYKYIEDDFYSNDSSNADLESRIAASEPGHPLGSYASDRVRAGKEEK
jgi:beta-N-acetylglucosaminidase